MDLRLKDKIVLVTGGSKGIGKEIAKQFISEGARVGIISRTLDSLEKIKEEFPQIEVFQGDVTDEWERARAFEQFISHFGRIDILINNVGGSNGTTTEDTSLSLFEDAIHLNYLSCVHFSKLALPLMKQAEQGSIVNISSIWGREAGGKPTYNAAKAAMISFTKSFADEVIAYGVRVNGVAPGSVLHPTANWQRRIDENPEKMKAFVQNEIPAGRFGTTKEIADVVLFLSSERASWVVGATINVDGGQSRSNF